MSVRFGYAEVLQAHSAKTSPRTMFSASGVRFRPAAPAQTGLTGIATGGPRLEGTRETLPNSPALAEGKRERRNLASRRSGFLFALLHSLLLGDLLSRVPLVSVLRSNYITQ